jgi:hypothetical protein
VFHIYSILSNFTLSFSIISVMMGVTTTYNTGLRYGGPASMTLGWIVVSALNDYVALSMANICSAYLTSDSEMQNASFCTASHAMGPMQQHYSDKSTVGELGKTLSPSKCRIIEIHEVGSRNSCGKKVKIYEKRVK